MKVLITGTSNGIGRETALLFLEKGHQVIGLDIEESTIDDLYYEHYVCDISDKNALPDISDVEILIDNAGVQDSGRDIDINLKGTIYVTEKYAFQPHIKSVLMMASASAHTGAEFPEYSASKGGMLAYMKNVAIRLAKDYKATCNSISAGGVITELNRPVLDDADLWQQIMDVTPLKRWATAREIADWIYMFTVYNQFCTGQDLLIDGGEKDLNSTFIWPDK